MHLTTVPKSICQIVSLLFLIPSICLARDVTLTWDANTEPDLAGYRLFVREAGQPYDYNFPEWEGTPNSCSVSGLDQYESYAFTVRAFNSDGVESGDSNEAYLETLNPSNKGSSGGGCFIDSLGSNT